MWASVGGKQRVMSKQTGKHGKLLLHARSAQQTETAALSMQVNPQAPSSSDVFL